MRPPTWNISGVNITWDGQGMTLVKNSVQIMAMVSRRQYASDYHIG